MTDLRPPALVVSKHVKAPVQRVFAAWTTADQVTRWWGPEGVECTHAEVDLRVGGAFRIANLLPDGSTSWISGIYEQIDAPNRLVHTWHVESDPTPTSERVTVDFIEVDGGTDITVTHTGFTDSTVRDGHAQGWAGCLDGLAELVG